MSSALAAIERRRAADAGADAGADTADARVFALAPDAALLWSTLVRQFCANGNRRGVLVLLFKGIAQLAADLVHQAAAAKGATRLALDAAALVAATLVEAVASWLYVAGFVSALDDDNEMSVAGLLAALGDADWGVGMLGPRLSVSARGALLRAVLALDIALAHAPSAADAAAGGASGVAAAGGDAVAGGGSAAE